MNKNNKIIEKTIIFLLILSFIFILFSCDSNAQEKQNTDSGNNNENNAETIENIEEEAIIISDGLPDIDMQGYEFSIFNFDDTWFTWRNNSILSEEQDGDIVNDALYIRQSQIEERFNCRLKTNEVADTTENIKKNVSSGDNTYQLYIIYDQNFGVLVPYVIDAKMIPHLRLDEKHWNPNATGMYNFSDKQLALAGNISLSVISGAGCMVFNKDIYKNFAGEDLYSLVRDNKWTLDKFFEIATAVGKDLNGDGIWNADDLYGLSSSFKGYISCIFNGAGIGFTAPGEDGVQAFNLHQNEVAINLMARCMDALNMPGFYYSEAVQVYDTLPRLFEPGQALFATSSAYGVETLRAMEDDIGILPLPKYSESQEQYYATAYGNSLSVLPKTLDLETEGENAGIILEAMSFSGYYDMIPQYKEVVLKTKTARDDESADMLDIIFDSVIFNFDMNILFDAVLQTTILPALWKDKTSGNIVSLGEKNANAINKYISTFYKAVDAVD
ncbi:MAG: hypothetical protein FWF92_02825 [Oscillospiraceae bacterium]|nr:hypothetical protein [Oscillospiraceae bacterium]